MFEKEKKRSCNTFGVELICEKSLDDKMTTGALVSRTLLEQNRNRN